ncbi:PAS domain S-box protein [Nocardia panacis]|uniref:PAS domain S-box protein n=1 Tax=Nocardia panacis TaxID=2340916 RepID=A0A3A4L4W0_9NOCA|nr:PAS domain-containing protein [Nocardia panacis]RJO77551.1 PAS domain S-box protein [Nocardia panacis]
MPTTSQPIADLSKSIAFAEDHRFGDAELFFSTTDRRGVIRQGNSVFVRIAGYSQAELVGAPHNIVRHPRMPAGVFALMWDRLEAGLPVCAYVRNQARDGASYWVFATMSPLRSGYLSVRVAPRAEAMGRIERIYARAHAVEQRLCRAGVGRRDRAVAGRAEIEKALREDGFGSYDEFVLDALPLEVAARDRLVSATYLRPQARGPIAEVLGGVAVLDRALDRLVTRLADYRDLCDQLADASAQLIDITERMNRSVAAAAAASAPIAESHPVLANVAQVMREPMDQAVVELRELRTGLDRLRGSVADLRFRISLAALYNDMVAAFAAEVVDGTAPPRSLDAVPALCEAAASGLTEMSERVDTVNAQMRAVAASTERAADALDRFRRFLGQWRILVLRHRARPLIGDRLEPIDAEIGVSWDWMELLYTLGREFRSGAVVFDVEAVGRQLDGIELAAAIVGIAG